MGEAEKADAGKKVVREAEKEGKKGKKEAGGGIKGSEEKGRT